MIWKSVVNPIAAVIVVAFCNAPVTSHRVRAADAAFNVAASQAKTLAMLDDESKSQRVNPPSRDPSKDKVDRDNDLQKGSPGLKLARSKVHALVPLLEHLKKRAPHQYEKAVRDLDRSARRLEAIKKRDEKLFEIATREWTLRSDLQLLKAKARVVKSSVDEEQLKQLQREIVAVQVERLEREIELIDTKKKGFDERLKVLKRQLEKAGDHHRPQQESRQPPRESASANQPESAAISLAAPALPCPVLPFFALAFFALASTAS